jgi:F420-dependent oxidoreductase-like protein
MRIGLGVGGGGDLAKELDDFKRAEAAGFAATWTPNIFGLDAIGLLALAGQVTTSVELGTFVVPTYPRHPMVMAQQALTTAAATNNRFTLGIGLSHKVVIEDMLGLDMSKPVRHMREYLSVLMPLLAGEAIRYKGEEYRVAGQVAVPGAQRPPVIVAALGPQMLRVAGKLADGTATWMGSAEYLEKTAIPAISQAAAEAGRPAPRIVSGFPIALTANKDAARESAGKSFAMYGNLPSYRATLDRGGAAGPADVAMIGTEEEIATQLRRLRDIGVTDFDTSPFPVRGEDGVVARTIEFMAGVAKSGL